MSTSINDLPVEILGDVMRFLDLRSLKAAILTCQMWKEIIEKYCVWSTSIDDSDKLHLVVRDLQETKRKFQINLTVYHELADKIDVYKQIGYTVTELSWNFDGHSTCLEYFKYFPNLEHIKVRDLEAPAMPDDCGAFDLKKLKSLETINCCHNIYKYFGTSNIKSLDICDMSVNSQCVINFIRRQKSLTKLTLLFVNDGGTFFQQLYHATPNGTVPFKLDHLAIDDGIPRTNYIELDKFIKLQSETLRKLKLDVELSYSILEIIFGKLNNLQSLGICLADETEFDESLKENLSIENLTLSEINFSPVALHQFCKRLPNVRHLYFAEGFNVELLQIVSTTLNNVTTLCVKKFDKNFEAIKFPNLTSMFIENLFVSKLNWTTFCKANSGITEMVIENVYFCDLKLKQIKMITRNLKLQTLKIGEGFSTNEHFLSIIHENCPELKVLQLLKSCGIKDLYWTDERATPLQLCDEIKIPNEIRFWYGAMTHRYTMMRSN